MAIDYLIYHANFFSFVCVWLLVFLPFLPLPLALQQGTSKVGAEFKVGVLGMSFGYFLQLTHEPKYNTLTWTLDYKKDR